MFCCIAHLCVIGTFHPISRNNHFLGPRCINALGLSPSANSSIQSPLFPILGNPQFALGLRRGTFKTLVKQGVFQASHFMASGDWPTFQMPTSENSPFQLDFWRAAQSRNFLHTFYFYLKNTVLRKEDFQLTFFSKMGGRWLWIEIFLRNSITIQYILFLNPQFVQKYRKQTSRFFLNGTEPWPLAIDIFQV